MSSEPKIRCESCVWVHLFKPRKDEEERGLTMGCRKPGWEGYTKPDNPACGGVFYFANAKPASQQVTP